MRYIKPNLSTNVPSYIADGLKKNLQSKVGITENVHRAQLVQAFEQGEMDKSDLTHFAFKDLGFGVLQDEAGSIWWVEGNKVFRQDDDYLTAAVEAYKDIKSKKGSMPGVGIDQGDQVEFTAMGMNLTGAVESVGNDIAKVRLEFPLDANQYEDYFVSRNTPKQRVVAMWQQLQALGNVEGNQLVRYNVPVYSVRKRI